VLTRNNYEFIDSYNKHAIFALTYDILIVIPIFYINYVYFNIYNNKMIDNWLFLTEQEILEEIGKRLKKIRLQHNLTQKEMSEEVGLSVSTISLIEQGRSTTVESLIRILMRLNRIKDLESALRVGENLELKLKFEKAKLKTERKRASKKIK